jgi:hypothetical protein
MLKQNKTLMKDSNDKHYFGFCYKIVFPSDKGLITRIYRELIKLNPPKSMTQ